MADTKGGWDKRQAKDAARALRRELGEAWAYMTTETREAFACQATMRFVSAVSRSDRGPFLDPDWIMDLHQNIRAELGLE